MKKTSRKSKQKKSAIKICVANWWKKEFKGEFYDFLLMKACDNNIEYVEDFNNADVIISNENRQIKTPREKTIFITGENIRPNFMDYRFSLSFDLDEYYGHNCYCPYWYTRIAWPGIKFKLSANAKWDTLTGFIDIKTLLSKRDIKKVQNRNKFCALIAKNPENLRINLYIFISLFYKKVDGFGEAFGNLEKQSKYEILKDYKFCLCPENSFHPGYITEKLIEAWYAGTLPIWCGPTNLKEVNYKALINYQDFKQMPDFVNKIISLDRNDEEFFNIYEQPILLKKPTITPVIQFLKKAIYEIIK